MKKLCLVLAIFLVPVLAWSQDVPTQATPVTELSSQAIQKVSDTSFTQVKSIQVFASWCVRRWTP